MLVYQRVFRRCSLPNMPHFAYSMGKFPNIPIFFWPLEVDSPDDLGRATRGGKTMALFLASTWLFS